jgi:hypothetical protein
MKKYICTLLVLYAAFNVCYAQNGKIIRFTSANAMFPDTARSNGHDYNGKYYDAATYYSDSSVLIYVPRHFSSKKKINYVFWFHGWGNNIDSACKQYSLLNQFEASGRNAIFIFPEGPKNAPDSYGGKLEQPQVFQGLMKEVVEKLTQQKVIRPVSVFEINAYDISLAGHSGAYRVISRIINKNPVNEVILFDAMYGQNDLYMQWLAQPGHRFINIYTKDGGTYDNSLFFIFKLTDSLHVPLVSLQEEEVTEAQLRKNNKLFIFSKQAHNDVILYNRNWERFLRNTPFKK